MGRTYRKNRKDDDFAYVKKSDRKKLLNADKKKIIYSDEYQEELEESVDRKKKRGDEYAT